MGGCVSVPKDSPVEPKKKEKDASRSISHEDLARKYPKSGTSKKSISNSDGKYKNMESSSTRYLHSGRLLLLLRSVFEYTQFPDEINKLIVNEFFLVKKKRAFLEYRRENYNVAFSYD